MVIFFLINLWNETMSLKFCYAITLKQSLLQQIRLGIIQVFYMTEAFEAWNSPSKTVW